MKKLIIFLALLNGLANTGYIAALMIHDQIHGSVTIKEGERTFVFIIFVIIFILMSVAIYFNFKFKSR